MQSLQYSYLSPPGPLYISLYADYNFDEGAPGIAAVTNECDFVDSTPLVAEEAFWSRDGTFMGFVGRLIVL